MKKFWSVVFLSLTIMSAAKADYLCKADTDPNESLVIKHLGFETTRIAASGVEATFTSNGQKEVFKGILSSLLNYDLYDLTDVSGKEVQIKISHPLNHGGRCGRCDSSPIPSLYYAKMITNDEEKEFTCALTF